MMISDVRHETVIGEDAVVDVASSRWRAHRGRGQDATRLLAAAGRYPVAGPVLPRAQAVNSPQVGSTTARESFEKGPVTTRYYLNAYEKYKQNV